MKCCGGSFVFVAQYDGALSDRLQRCLLPLPQRGTVAKNVFLSFLRTKLLNGFLNVTVPWVCQWIDVGILYG